MKQLSSADFRKAYASLSEPHEVTSYGHIIGTWIPAGAELPTPVEAAPAPEPVAETAPPRMTIRPVKGTPKEMVAETKRILDPVQQRQKEREIWSQLQAKMYPSRGSRER